MGNEALVGFHFSRFQISGISQLLVFGPHGFLPLIHKISLSGGVGLAESGISYFRISHFRSDEFAIAPSDH